MFRRSLKILSAAMLAAILVAWAASALHNIRLSWGPAAVTVDCGHVEFLHFPARRPGFSQFGFPLWIAATLSLICAALTSLCLGARTPANCCFDCGYNWRGVRGKRCPECGGLRAVIRRRAGRARRRRAVERSVWTGAASVLLLFATVFTLGIVPAALTASAAFVVFPEFFEPRTDVPDVPFWVIVGIFAAWLSVAAITYVCLSKRLFRRFLRWEVS